MSDHPIVNRKTFLQSLKDMGVAFLSGVRYPLPGETYYFWYADKPRPLGPFEVSHWQVSPNSWAFRPEHYAIVAPTKTNAIGDHPCAAMCGRACDCAQPFQCVGCSCCHPVASESDRLTMEVSQLKNDNERLRAQVSRLTDDCVVCGHEPHLKSCCVLCDADCLQCEVKRLKVLIQDYEKRPTAVRIVELEAEVERLRAILNTPETEEFDHALPLEAAHQVERWGAAHDAGKTPEDWFWLVGYLAGKSLAASKAGDLYKAKHHCISTAAALRNWHAHLRAGSSAMRPGLSADKTAAIEAPTNGHLPGCWFDDQRGVYCCDDGCEIKRINDMAMKQEAR